MNCRIVVVFLFLFFFLDLTAQNFSDKINVSGKFELDHISYFKNQDNKINGRNEILLSLKAKSKEVTQIGYYSEVEVREDLSNSERNRFYLREAYCNWKSDKIEFKIGKQLIEWGYANKVKPVDNICPIDYTDFLDYEKIGVYALNAQYYSKFGEFQLLYIPVFNKTLLPEFNSRWYLNQPELLAKEQDIADYSSTIIGQNNPEAEERSHQIAVKFAKSFRGFDIDVNYYKGYVHIPECIYTSKLINSDSIHFNIRKNYYKQDIFGTSVSKVMGKYSFRSDVAFFMPDGEVNKSNYLRYSLGLDRTFYDVLGYNSISALLQWMDEQHESNVYYSNYDINHLFRQSVLFKLDFSIEMFAKISLLGIYNCKTDDYYIQSSVKYSFGRGLNLYWSVDLTGGESGGFYSYYNNNRTQLKLEYNF